MCKRKELKTKNKNKMILKKTKKKKAYYFMVDALITVIILTIGYFLLISHYTSKPYLIQTQHISEDIIGLLSASYIYDLCAAAQCSDSKLKDIYNGIGNKNNTLLELLGELHKKNQDPTARELIKSLIVENKLVPENFNFSFYIDKQLIYPLKTSPKKISRLLVSQKKLIFSYYKGSIIYWGPYVAETRVWQIEPVECRVNEDCGLGFLCLDGFCYDLTKGCLGEEINTCESYCGASHCYCNKQGICEFTWGDTVSFKPRGDPCDLLQGDIDCQYGFNCIDVGEGNIGECKCDTVVNPTCETGIVRPYCGDCIKNQLSEDCDGSDLAKETCNTLGFTSGELSCKSNCEFDKSKCTGTNYCGDGIINTYTYKNVEGDILPIQEVCDSSSLNGKTCSSFGYSGGNLRCRGDCRGFDFTDCTGVKVCGNGNIDAEYEDCDQSDFHKRNCQYFGYDQGNIKCTDNCEIDFSECIDYDSTHCGTDDNEIDQSIEYCDEEDLNEMTCSSFTCNSEQIFNSGTLSCNSDCTFNYKNCKVSDEYCGDKKLGLQEQCDTTAPGYEPTTCNELGCEGESEVNCNLPKTTDECQWDKSLCTDCPTCDFKVDCNADCTTDMSEVNVLIYNYITNGEYSCNIQYYLDPIIKGDALKNPEIDRLLQCSYHLYDSSGLQQNIGHKYGSEGNWWEENWCETIIRP